MLGGSLVLSSGFAGAFANTGLKPLKVAVVGCGDRGQGLISVLKQMPDLFEIAAICDVLDFRLTETLKIYSYASLKQYKDYRKLLEDKSISAVFIATPLNIHFPVAKAALNSGKHVYLEKTMTYSVPETFELVNIVKGFPKQVFQVGHQYRYTPLYFKVKEMIEKGYLGKVTQIGCRWDRNWNWRRKVSDPALERQINWRMYKESSGGLVAELLSHQIDFINWAFNTQPDTVFATGGIDNYRDGRETFDNVQVMFRYADTGMVGNFGATCSNSRDGYLFKLKGSKGTVSLLMNEGFFYPEAETKKELETVDGVTGATKITWSKDGGIPILQEPGEDGTVYGLRDFHSCILNKKQPTSNVITGAKTAFSVHLANQALYEQKILNWQPDFTKSIR
jgi:predicted dehydrogenase